MSSYIIDNTQRPIAITRPGEEHPSFYVASMAEAFAVIDVDKAGEEARLECADCSQEHCPCLAK